jgi:succinate dehydrogenase/fumarate reductase cytochrome b subunit
MTPDTSDRQSQAVYVVLVVVGIVLAIVGWWRFIF